MQRLTDASVRALPCPQQGVRIHYDDAVSGFGIRCSQGGSKSYVLTFGTDRRRTTIGKVGVLGLAEARNVAKRILAEHTLGKHRAPRVTYAEALETFLEQKAQQNRSRTMKDTSRILNKYFDSLKKKNLEDIATHDITRITDRLAKPTPGTARHAFSEVRTFLRWCVKRRHIQHSPIEGLEPPSPARSRERILSDGELRAVWAAAPDNPFGKVVRLLILLGTRRGETVAIQPAWVTGDTLVIPSEHTKNKRMHTIPLPALAASLITTETCNGWSKAKAALDSKIAIARGSEDDPSPLPPWTLHDLRRTYATNLQRLGVKLEVIEALLNHVSGTRAGIVGVYNRHRYEAEMREAVTVFDEWFTKVILAE